jgi:hypothetical protein
VPVNLSNTPQTATLKLETRTETAAEPAETVAEARQALAILVMQEAVEAQIPEPAGRIREELGGRVGQLGLNAEVSAASPQRKYAMAMNV